MFLTEKHQLEEYTSEYRIWQGIPGIEVTKNRRIFSAFYSGGIRESIGNYVMLLKSDDGENFTEPIAVFYKENYRYYDPVLWIDPLGRLWFFVSRAPENCVFAVVCENPDDKELLWSEPRKIGAEVMMNKPIVLQNGTWLFPIASWDLEMGGIGCMESGNSDRRAFAYASNDNGVTFEKIGGIAIKDRTFDEHMFLEMQDGTISMFVRTKYGIGVSCSNDFGKTWDAGKDSGLGGPSSRFFIRRLKSGRILQINHYNFKGRNNLYAMLSEDEGKTWKYKLLLDERNDISYPDAVEADDGFIYITYDRERGDMQNSLSNVYGCAREILIAKIKEQDIIDGKLSNEKSYLKGIISKLTKYAFENDNLFTEMQKICTVEEIGVAKHLFPRSYEKVLERIEEDFPGLTEKFAPEERKEYNDLLMDLKNENGIREMIACKIIKLLNSKK